MSTIHSVTKFGRFQEGSDRLQELLKRHGLEPTECLHAGYVHVGDGTTIYWDTEDITVIEIKK